MARAGIGSRRSSEKLIRQGRVRVNGVVARLGDRADPQEDEITVDGRRISREAPIYVMLNKPRGVLSSTEDELDQDRTTVIDLVPFDAHIYPVGRLDKPSEGLILLTNDGRLAHRLTHPRYEHEKVYEVQLEGAISDEALEQWRRGLMLAGKRTAPAGIVVEERRREQTRLIVTLREGRKRQIRRIAAAFGHPVQRLFRRAIGPLQIGDLPSGQWRHLTEAEVRTLRESVAKKQPPPRRGKKRRVERKRK